MESSTVISAQSYSFSQTDRLACPWSSLHHLLCQTWFYPLHKNAGTLEWFTSTYHHHLLSLCIFSLWGFRCLWAAFLGLWTIFTSLWTWPLGIWPHSSGFSPCCSTLPAERDVVISHCFQDQGIFDCQECWLLTSQSWAFPGTWSPSKETSMPKAMSLLQRWLIFNNCPDPLPQFQTTVKAHPTSRTPQEINLVSGHPFPLPGPASFTLLGILFLKVLLKNSLHVDLNFTVSIPETLTYEVPITLFLLWLLCCCCHHMPYKERKSCKLWRCQRSWFW